MISAMDPTINQLLVEMDKVAQSVAKLEADLEVARAKGKELFREFQKRQVEIASKFGMSSDSVGSGSGRRAKRAPRSLESRIMTSVTRMLNALEGEGVSPKEAKPRVLDAALGVARKNGANEVPAEVVKVIDARLKEFGKGK